ncbi:MAG: LacI family DNA-binding transcriptional regulator [Lachnospiraceae bacterium]|nr:LacI family DNA-binding transcriptional regulator [Lachnospiraceae bacterium]
MADVTIYDVAKAAGVSVATVSRIMKTPEIVKRETRERVMKVIEEMNYQPNALARQLRTQQTNMIIVIVPDIENAFYHEIIRGIEAEAEANGYQVLIADLKGQPSLEKYYVEAIQRHQVDGIISISASMAEKLLEIVTGDYPVVMVVQGIDKENVPNITIDNATAARKMMSHLISIGHKEIAHITSSEALPLYQERLKGYIAALEGNGISVDEELIRKGEASIRGGYEQMEILIRKKKKFSAVFAAGDTMAIGAIKALKDNGLSVPEDCAVVGFDDIDIASFFEPALTTVRQPKRQMGEVAFRKLLAKIKKESIEDIRTVLPYEIVIRDSCGYLKRLQ